VLVNENVADFRAYAAIQLADLWVFLEDLAQAFAQQQGWPLPEGRSFMKHSGLGTVRQWLEHALVVVETQ
jgi:hypothetical protein